MHWWQSAFSPPPSSPPSSTGMNLLDTYTGLDDQPKSSLFSFGGRAFGFRSHQRRLTRSKRLQDINQDVPSPHQLSRSPSGCTVAPQPLPLPELAVLLRQDAAHALPPSNSTASVRLPSPRTNKDQAPAHPSKCRGGGGGGGGGGGEDREKSSEALRRDAHGNGDAVTSTAGFASKQACQDARRRTEHVETLASRRSPKRPYGAEKSPNNYMLPNSVPSSSFSSPSLSPHRSPGDLFTSHHTSPQVFPVWSAPELAPSDMTLGFGHSYQMPCDTTAISVDNSPLHNPRLSFGHNATSPSGSVSPLHPRLSTDTPTARRESNAQTNVHPLPRPPAAAMLSQPAPSPKVTAKPERMKSRWKKGKLIGRGTFGSVYVGSNRETGALCAMKEVELLPHDPKSTECIRQLEQEINVLSQLKHPNIVQYYGSEIVGDRFYIYLEYVHPGSLVNYIRDHCGAITESVVRNFTRHILSGLAYLHSTKTIHRDIKGANLLVDAYGVVKLADFGMAKHLTEQAANLSLKGSPYWMAPELLQSVMQNDSNPDLALAVDIWSLGCTIIEMMNGKPPWSECEGPAAMFKVLRETPPIPETLSPEGKDFLCCCFQRNPAERPSASMLLEHRFMKNLQQPDFSSCNQALNGMKLLDKAHPQAERPTPIYKLDHVPVSTGAQSTRGKVAYSETGQRSSGETSEWTVAPRHSPRSTLEPLLILSSSGLGQSIDHSSPSATVPSSMKQVVRSNRPQ